MDRWCRGAVHRRSLWQSPQAFTPLKSASTAGGTPDVVDAHQADRPVARRRSRARHVVVNQGGEIIGEATLKRTLGPWALVALGIGAIIGAGLFVRTAAAIADRAGPSVVLAFIVAGIGCAFAGLCYAEFASMIPIAGSAYTYSYATMGELIAWIIGWDLVLEYAVGAATVAIAWSEYFNSVLGLVRRAASPTVVPLAVRASRRTGVARHHEPAGDRHPALLTAAAGARHPGVGLRQQHHRDHRRSPSCSW